MRFSIDLPLETSRLCIRAFEPRDLLPFVAYRAEPAVARFQSWANFNLDDGRAFLHSLDGLSPGVPGQWFQFALELKAERVLVGDVGFRRLADEPRMAEIGFTLAGNRQGQGLAREALECLLTQLFACGLHRVIATTDALNLPSARLLERLGFRREGHFLQNIFFKGAWGDEFFYAILADEWAARPLYAASLHS